MVKRTRRNLSDPRIKKIIKAQLSRLSDISKPPHHQHHDGTAGKYFLIFVIFLLVSVSALLLYVNWSDVNRFFNTTFSENSAAKQTVPPPSSGSSGAQSTIEPAGEPAEQPAEPEKTQPPPLQPVTRNFQVEVLNGCGIDGLAKQVTAFLRKKDVDVVSQGNYQNFNVRNTFILDRVDNSERARQLAEILGISREQIQLNKDSNLQLDATVVLGADYKSLKPFTN